MRVKFHGGEAADQVFKADLPTIHVPRKRQKLIAKLNLYENCFFPERNDTFVSSLFNSIK